MAFLNFPPDLRRFFILTELPEKDCIKFQPFCFVNCKYQFRMQGLFQFDFFIIVPYQYNLSRAGYLDFFNHLVFFYSINKKSGFSVELPLLSHLPAGKTDKLLLEIEKGIGKLNNIPDAPEI